MSAISSTAIWVVRRATGALTPSRHFHILSFRRPFPIQIRPPLSDSGLCRLSKSINGDTDNMLRGVLDKSAVKHILDVGRRAVSRREILHTDFLTPPVLKESMLVLEKLADVKAIVQGGYPQLSNFRLSVAGYR